jgi:sugar phosphate isomerase/epimerase
MLLLHSLIDVVAVPLLGPGRLMKNRGGIAMQVVVGVGAACLTLCGWLHAADWPRYRADAARSKALADTFNQLAETLKPLGMACGYHNHVGEFKKDGDKTYWDLFAERTSRDVILQQDCGWTLAAGFDPVAYIRKYPGRTRTTHFKPMVREGETGKKAILGQDSAEGLFVHRLLEAIAELDVLLPQAQELLMHGPVFGLHIPQIHVSPPGRSD